MRMNKERAAEMLHFTIEETSGSLKFLTPFGNEVTLAEAEQNISEIRETVDRLSEDASAVWRGDQWEYLNDLGAWIEIQKHLSGKVDPVLRMSKEKAAEDLGLTIEENDGNFRFLKKSGKAITLADVRSNLAAAQAAVKVMESDSGRAVTYIQQRTVVILDAWTEIQKHLEEAKQSAPRRRRTHMPSMFDDEQFREMMTVITSHRLFKTVDVERSFAHTVNCITCGELSVDDDQEFHIAHMLTDAGFRKTPEVFYSDLSC